MNLCVLHITNSCNLKCKHCYASSGTRFENEMSFEEIKNLVDQLEEMNVTYVTVTGGEPLMRPDVFEIIKYIRNKNMNVMLTTNGTLMTQEIIDKLKNLGVDSVQISIDSHLEQVHDAFRGMQGAYKKSIEGIKLCKKNNMKVSIMSTLSAINRKYLRELMNLALELKVDAFGIERFVPEGRGIANEKEIIISADDLKRCLEILYEYRKSSKETFFTTNDPLFAFVDGSYKTLYDLYKKNPKLCGGCSVGHASFVITPDGEVGLCTRLYKRIGSIREKNIKDIISENEVIQKICDRDNLEGRCGKCKYKKICGGCRGWAYNTTGNYLSEDNLCWLKDDEIFNE